MLKNKNVLKTQFKKKRKGAYGCMILSVLFILAIVSITFYKIEERRSYFAKKTMDNAVILSLQSANLVDIYEFATREQILYDACKKEGGLYSSEYGNCSDSNLETGTIVAYERAKNRFLDTFLFNGNMQTSDSVHFIKNNDLDCKFYKSVTLSRFVMYNVYDGYVYEYDGAGSVSCIGEVSNNITVGTGDVITNSGIYIEMDFVLTLMGKDFNMPIKQYVDITSS